jgi:UDP-N-acetylmuramate: L-alanyl-gamma-D-glutamyl-meso-diaminopimelate ligase
VETFSAQDEAATWSAKYDLIGAKSRFSVFRHGEKLGQTGWALLGQHNLENALAAISAAAHAGVGVDLSLEVWSQFQGVKRRLEKRGVYQAITVYEDFAHHPTAIATTLAALRTQNPDRRIVAVVEPRSNTMRMGVHKDALRRAFDDADKVFVLASDGLDWNPETAFATLGGKLAVERDVQHMVSRLDHELERGDQVVLMSNGSFQGLPRMLQQALKSRDVQEIAE